MSLPLTQATRNDALTLTLISVPQLPLDSSGIAKMHAVRKKLVLTECDCLYWSHDVSGKRCPAKDCATILFSGVERNKRPPIAPLLPRDFTAPKNNISYKEFSVWGKRVEAHHTQRNVAYRMSDSDPLSPHIHDEFRADIIKTWNSLHRATRAREVLLVTHGTLIHFIASALFEEHRGVFADIAIRNYDVLHLRKDTYSY